ncbi:recombinase family protein [Xylanimonas protaetiae]|uniref:Recombinase family protein n=1 Tax=Xylanimonas protaetiae TaxID=2509457 RepID=A0A4P6F4W2_9MICO|nr:recombinase family protein [Xylanimonas protaetiae]QAY70386.1 recombinase family protein [Xylanimonas protaetiae]
MSATRLRVVPDPANTPRRAIIYARASRDRTRRAKSTKSQVDRCEWEASMRGWTVVETVVDDDRSASEYARKGRDGWSAVVEKIERGDADVLLMWEGSRATRALDAYVDLEKQLRRRNVLLSYDGETYDLAKPSDRRRAAQDAVEARYEADRIRARITRQKATDAQTGWMASQVPYGYLRTYDKRTGGLLGQEPEPHSAAVVRWMVDAILVDGMTPNSIATEMNRRDEPTPGEWREMQKGLPRPTSLGWTSKTVQQVLRGPAIAGLRQHRPADGGPEALYEAVWPAIITAEERDTLLAATYRTDRRTHQSNAPAHLLTWLARCGECGGAIRHRAQRNKGRVHRAYQCANRRCGRVYIQQGPTDEHVTAVLIGFVSNPATRATLLGVARPASAGLGLIDGVRRAAELTSKKDDLRVAFLAGSLSAETLGEVSRDIDRELAQIEAARQPAPVTGPAVLRLASSDDVAATWRALSLADRRQVLRGLFEITLTRASAKGQRTFDTGRVVVRRA